MENKQEIFIDGRDIVGLGEELAKSLSELKWVKKGIVFYKGNDVSRDIYTYKNKYFVVKEINSYVNEIYDVTLIEIDKKQILI